MRDIRFRAFHKTGKIMRMVAHISNLLTVGTYVDVRINDPEAVTKIEQEWNEEDFILMQYTGLSDKNGVPIYEGDVVQTQAMKPGQVIYNGCGFYFHRYLVSEFARIDIEVMGNIYENPELLEDTQ